MIGMALFQPLISPAGFFSHFRLWGKNPAGFFKKIKRFVFNCIALQNNIEAELKFFSSFEAFQAKYKKTRGGKPPRGFSPTK